MQVLVAGGDQGANGSTASAELYDSNSGTWNPTGSMATARDGHGIALLPNGEVLVMGGAENIDSAELYSSE